MPSLAAGVVPIYVRTSFPIYGQWQWDIRLPKKSSTIKNIKTNLPHNNLFIVYIDKSYIVKTSAALSRYSWSKR